MKKYQICTVAPKEEIGALVRVAEAEDDNAVFCMIAAFGTSQQIEICEDDRLVARIHPDQITTRIIRGPQSG